MAASQPSNDPFSLRRSAQSLHEVAHLVARLAKHADHLQCATAATADLHTSLQALSDDLVVTASTLKIQCQPYLENLAAVQGLSCSDDLMDELLHRMFSSKSTDMEDVGMPMLSPMTSLDALSTCQLLDGLVKQSSHGQALVDEQLDSLLGSLPSPPCTVEGLEQHTLMRQLSLDGDAERTRK
jgi:hypothetical protein